MLHDNTQKVILLVPKRNPTFSLYVIYISVAGDNIPNGSYDQNAFIKKAKWPELRKVNGLRERVEQILD